MPKGATLPRPGRSVRVSVGEPVPVADLLSSAREQNWPEDELHAAIAARVGDALYRLKAELDGVPLQDAMPERAPGLDLGDGALLPLIGAIVSSPLPLPEAAPEV